jgi:transposase
VQAKSLRLQRQLQGAWPVVDHFLQRLQWPSLLARFLPCAHYAAALELLVKSVLLRPSALYRIEAWAQRYDPALRPAGHLGDDAIGRALDQLFAADRASLLTALILQALRAFRVDTSQIHNDSTSVKFTGAYARQDPAGLQLRRGASKDHRPDLKQLVYCLSVSADEALPIHFKAYSGNQADDPTHWETWQSLRRLLDKTDFLYVADSKLCDRKTMQKITAEQGRFVTMVPRNRKEVTAFAEEAAAGQVCWEPLWTRRSERAPSHREAFAVATGSYPFAQQFRLYWYRSSEKRQRDAQDRQGRIAKALGRLERLNERRGRGPKTEPAIRRAAENLLAHYHVSGLVEFQIESQPAPPTARAVGPKLRPVLSAHRNEAACGRAATLDGTFPLVTNTTLSALETLQSYKYQPHLEKRHFLNKSVLEVAPGFLKKNTRIEALMFVYFTAQLVAALMERQVRQNMRRRRIEAIPILPEERPSKSPSYAQILETFSDRAKTELYEHDQLIEIFVDPISELQQTVLQLLDIDAAVYK